MKNLQYLVIDQFKTQSGQIFEQLKLAYITYGTLNKEKSNVIFIIHPLTATADAIQWWSGIIGKGKVFDTDNYFIVCINIPGSPYGSTSPLSINPKTNKAYYYDFPTITARDVVIAFEHVRKHLEIEQIRILAGLSMGGQIVFEWIHFCPLVAQRAIIVASSPKTTPWMLSSLYVQRNALALDKSWKRDESENAGKDGMKIARQIAFLSYRSPKILSLAHVLNIGKGNNADEQGFVLDSKNNINFLKSYFDYQGEKFSDRFNAFSYDVFLTLMEKHDISSGNKTIEQALAEIKADVLLVAVDSDQLFTREEVKDSAQYIKNVRYSEISSIYGHDAILIEHKQIEDIIVDYLHQVDYRL